MTGDQPSPKEEYRLSIGGDDKVHCSPALQRECQDWSLNIQGMQRDAAIAYLRYQSQAAKSDGIDCTYVDMILSYDAWMVPQFEAAKTGPCMCSRLLCMLFDVPYEEADRDKFKMIMEFLARKLDVITVDDPQNQLTTDPVQ